MSHPWAMDTQGLTRFEARRGARSGLIAEANRTGVELLISDLDVALALMDRAASATDDTSRAAFHAEAGRAYRAVWKFVDKLTPTHEQKTRLEKRLIQLRRRLALAGVRFV